MLRIGICDDVRETVEYHANVVQRIMRQLSLNVDIRKCYTGNELLIEMEDGGNFHLILLDIEMENMNGIETARKIRSLDHYVVLIFVTAYNQYSREAIEVQPFAYLNKALDYFEVKKAIEEAYNRQIEIEENFSFQVNRIWHSMALKDIYYFRSELRKIYIIGKLSEQCFYGKMDRVEDRLQHKRHTFLRIHKSFLVNCRYIARYSYERIVLRNGDELEISRSNRSMVRKYYMEMLDSGM
ncbi:MAG: response regulator transcription factor [Lachnospiraceae bacterium]|nr:response regulator transcription factor [Lachnospiraceae bacterium]